MSKQLAPLRQSVSTIFVASPPSPILWGIWLRAWSASCLILILATWPLWTPRPVFPQVPFFAWAVFAPGWLDAVALTVVIATLAYITLAGRRHAKLMLLALAGSLVFLVLLDQSRFQPWVYLAVLFAICMGGAPPRRATAYMRLIVVSLYAYSAVSKLDYSFLHTIGQQFLRVLGDLASVDIDGISPRSRAGLALLLPLWELGVAVAISLRKSRIMGVIAAVMMHAMLIILLGPWGLNHKPGVLLWNGYFILQAIFLFGLIGPGEGPRVADSPAPAAEADPEPPSSRALWGMVTLVVFLPVLEPIGWFDHWPAWGLYSSRNSQVTLLVKSAAASRLPGEVREHVEPSSSDDAWSRVRLDQWSLDTVRAPIYPQARVQLGVARAVVEHWRLRDDFQIIVSGAAKRFDGERRRRTITNMRALLAESQNYWFNVQPRQGFVARKYEDRSRGM